MIGFDVLFWLSLYDTLMMLKISFNVELMLDLKKKLLTQIN